MSAIEASDASAVEASGRLSAIAGSPTPEEFAEKSKGHKMKKRRVGGRDFWECEKCQWTTFNADSAEEHAKTPY